MIASVSIASMRVTSDSLHSSNGPPTQLVGRSSLSG